MVQDDDKCRPASVDFHPHASVRLVGRVVLFAHGLGSGHLLALARYAEANMADTRRLAADRVSSGSIGHSALALRRPGTCKE